MSVRDGELSMRVMGGNRYNASGENPLNLAPSKKPTCFGEIL